MQPRTEAPRDGLTDADVVTLLQDAPALTVQAGMELVDLGLNVVEDISGDLAGGTVRRNSYAEMHGTADFEIARELDWGAGLIRPYLIVSSITLSARWNLGVYHPSTPEDSTRESPQTFAVDGYDILLRLAQPVGDAYAIAAGASYLATVEAILLARGYRAYIIDQSAAATVAPASRTWAFDQQITWLTVVNDLLASIGYAGIWSDWNGRLRCEPYVLPQLRAPEWTYTDEQATTMLGPDRRRVRDYFAAPNRWVVYRQNNLDDKPPVEGAGVYTYVNDSVGDTSVQARGGLEITKVAGVDAADQGALIAQAQQIIQADMDIQAVWTVTVSPNPGHWHFDRLFADTTDLLADVQCTSWVLPLDGGDMTQTWRVIAQ
jgi:hypothetical protein